MQGGQLWISVNVQAQSNSITLTANPPSPASANPVRIYARVNNFPNLRALRVLVDGRPICELGAPEIFDCNWNTSGISSGQHTIVAEADDWIGVPWDTPRRRSLVYQLNGSAIANHAPDRPTLQSPYNWYLKDAAGSGAPVQMCVSSVSDPDGNAVQYWFELLNIILDPVDNSGWINGNCWEPTLAPGGYAWRVKAGDNLGAESDWSADTWNFNVAEGNVSIGDPTVYQANDPDNTHICVPVTYGGILGAEVQAFINLAADGTDSGEWFLLDHYGPNTTPDCTQPNVHGFWIRSARYVTGNHLIQIKAIKRDSGATDTRTLIHTIPFMRPPAPQLIAPSTLEDNGTWWNTPAVTFQWNEALRAESYQLRASTNQDLWNDPSPLLDVTLDSTARSYAHTFGQDYGQLYWSVRATNTAGSVDSGLGVWFGIDRVAPSCAVQPLVATTWENVFQVNWNGTDDSAGIRAYDIQFMDSNRGAWNDWQLDVPGDKTYDLFLGQPGHSYSFRCQAIDNAGNAGSYPDTADTSTKIDLTTRPQTPWWDSAYESKHNITVLNNMVGIPLPTGYPVRLHFDSNTAPTAAEIYNVSQAAIKCDDLRIVYNDTTELDRLVDSCSSTAIDIWFRTQVGIPSGSSDNTTHQLYYGNSAATNPPASLTQVFWPEIDANTLRYYAMREGAGATLFDATGHGDASMSPALSWTQAGKFGPAVQFPTDDGPEPRPAIDDGSAFMPVNAFTVEFWLKRGPVDGGNIANQDVGGYPARWRIFIDGRSLRLSVWPDPVSVSATVENARDLSEPTFFTQFHHFAVTFDGVNQVRFYIDGQLDAVRTLSQSGFRTSDSPLRIGATSVNNGRLSGQMFGFVLSEGVKTDFTYGTHAAITNEPSLAVGTLISPSATRALVASLAAAAPDLPDLAVLSLNTYPNPAGGVLVEVVVENLSDSETLNGFFTDLYLDHVPTGAGDFSGSLQFWVNDPVDAGAQLTLTTVITDLTDANGKSLQDVRPAGEVRGTLSAQTDSTGSLSEPDEVNNIYALGTDICLAAQDAYESDDTFESASVLSVGQAQTHNFDRPGDGDWFKFDAQAGTIYNLHTLNLGAAADTTLSLYDTDGLTLLASNDDFDESLASQIEWTAPTTSTYYVFVQHWNPNAGGCGTAYTLEMTAVTPNAPPVVSANQPTIVVNEGDIAANSGAVSDPDSDYVLLTATPIGAATNNNDGTWSWIFGSSDGAIESQAVTIFADDGNGEVSQVTFSLIVNNVAPTATFTNTSGTISLGSVATLTFSNPFDPSPPDTAAGFLYSYDCINDGSFELTNSTSPMFMCPYNTAGTFSAQGRIQDKDGGFTEYLAQVVVNPPPQNHSPVATDDGYTTTENTPLTVSAPGVLTNDNDADNDTLSVGSNTPPANGTVVMNTDGSFAYAPNMNFKGTDSFTYQVCDTQGACDTGMVTIIVNLVNNLPVLTTNQPSVTIDEGQTATNSGTVNDPDGDFVLLTAVPMGVAINNGNGTWSWNFPTTDNLESNLAVIISGDDGNGGIGQTTFGLTVNNVAPTVFAGDEATITPGSTFTVNATFTDPGTGDTHTATIDFGTGGSAQPAAVIQNAGSGIVSGSNTYLQPGNYTINVCVTDDDGGTGCDTLVVTVVSQPPVNQAPICTSATPSVASLWPPNHDLVPINVLGITDPEGDPVLITVISIFQDEPVNGTGDGDTSPDGQGVATPTAVVRAERAGTENGRVYHIFFTADDGHGGVCSGEVLVSVPKDQGNNGAAVDDGAVYDSTLP